MALDSRRPDHKMTLNCEAFDEGRGEVGMSSSQPRTLETLERIPVGGVPFVSTDLEEAVSLLLQEASSQTGYRGSVRFANAYCISEASKNLSYRLLLENSGINFPDGKPISLYMRRGKNTGVFQSQQVRGPSAFELALDSGQALGIRHFFLGSTPETLEMLIDSVRIKYPAAVVVGSHSPEFGPLDKNFFETCVSEITQTDPDIVWVGLGTPKQDFASEELASATGTICAGVGAAFDFTAGSKREAPTWVRKAGVEWLFRLISEPGRLWKRYLFGNIKFLWVSERALWKERG